MLWMSEHVSPIAAIVVLFPTKQTPSRHCLYGGRDEQILYTPRKLLSPTQFPMYLISSYM